MGCIALVRYVLVLRCGLAGVVLYPDAGWSTSASACIRIQHQHTSYQSNTTHEITQPISRKLLKMDVLTSETCWALNNEIKKQVTSSWSLFTQIPYYLLPYVYSLFPKPVHHIIRFSASFFKFQYFPFSFRASSRGWSHLPPKRAILKLQTTNSVSHTQQHWFCKERHISGQNDVKIPLRMDHVGCLCYEAFIKKKIVYDVCFLKVLAFNILLLLATS